MILSKLLLLLSNFPLYPYINLSHFLIQFQLHLINTLSFALLFCEFIRYDSLLFSHTAIYKYLRYFKPWLLSHLLLNNQYFSLLLRSVTQIQAVIFKFLPFAILIFTPYAIKF